MTNWTRVFCLGMAITLTTSCGMNSARLEHAELDFAKQHYQSAFNRLQLPARSGDPNAQYALGYLYFYGKGVVEDKERARYWFELAAAQGHPDARNAIRMIKSSEKKFKWPHRALHDVREPQELPFRAP